jgi:hypothetical protein
MAANDGPIPVRVLAQAARVLREARQLGRYGIAASQPIRDYPQLLVRERGVVQDVCEHSARREYIERLGATIYQRSDTGDLGICMTNVVWTGRRRMRNLQLKWTVLRPSIEPSIDEDAVSEFQDFSEELRQPGGVVGLLSQIYLSIINTSMGFKSVFSFPVCRFDGRDWMRQGANPSTSPTSMSIESHRFHRNHSSR